MNHKATRLVIFTLVFAIFLTYFTTRVEESRWESSVPYAGDLTLEMKRRIWGDEVEKKDKGLSGHEIRFLGWLIEAEYSWHGLKSNVTKGVPGGKRTIDVVIIVILVLALIPVFWPKKTQPAA